MRKLCVFLGLTAICYGLNVGYMFALFVGLPAANSISLLVAAAISAGFVAGCRLGGRIASPSWVVWAFGAAGALVLLARFPSGVFSNWLLFTLGLMGRSVLFSVLDAVMLLCLLKLAADLMPAGKVGEGT